jgi:hypothetical protein
VTLDVTVDFDLAEALLEDGASRKGDSKSIVHGKVWPNPDASGVSQVVVVDESGIRVVGRLIIFTAVMMVGIVRLGMDDVKGLSEIYSDLNRLLKKSLLTGNRIFFGCSRRS